MKALLAVDERPNSMLAVKYAVEPIRHLAKRAEAIANFARKVRVDLILVGWYGHGRVLFP